MNLLVRGWRSISSQVHWTQTSSRWILLGPLPIPSANQPLVTHPRDQTITWRLLCVAVGWCGEHYVLRSLHTPLSRVRAKGSFSGQNHASISRANQLQGWEFAVERQMCDSQGFKVELVYMSCSWNTVEQTCISHIVFIHPLVAKYVHLADSLWSQN